MKKTYRYDDISLKSLESYSFDDGLSKSDAIDIVDRFNNIGAISNIRGRNYEEYTDNVECKFSSFISLKQQIDFLDVDYISFSFSKDHVGYSISIKIPNSSVSISYRTKSIPYDFETLFKEIELGLKKKDKTL